MMELVVAVLLFSTVGLLVISVFPTTVLGTRTAGDRAVAALVAQGVLEQARVGPLDQLADATWPVATAQRDYDVTLRVTNLGDGSLARNVNVSVSWKSRAGKASEYRVGTTIFKD